MRIVCISDTHSRHREIPDIPDGDILVHAGDCTGSGSLPALDEFTQWFGSLPHSRKILIAGNHDFSFEKYPAWSREMCEKSGILYLQDEQLTINGLVFFGSPWTPLYKQMAFNADETKMFEVRAGIPDSTNVLITHGPAWRVLDYVPRDSEHAGCFPLAKRIDELLELRVHVCGHIHEGYGYGVRESDGLTFVNASSCDGHYRPINPPITIDI
ncbi:metallophosphoesterase [Marinobacter sp. B9-2]|nr:metallophosphoesterase [Marinobacter sp. B9-2]